MSVSVDERTVLPPGEHCTLTERSSGPEIPRTFQHRRFSVHTNMKHGKMHDDRKEQEEHEHT